MTQMSSIYCLLLLLCLGAYASGQCQVGFVTSDYCREGQNCQWLKYVSFKKPFPSPPDVVTALALLDSWRGGNIRLNMRPTSISTHGFVMNFGVWGQNTDPPTHIYRLKAAWTACPKV
ncbi:uncharacterized protein LOC106158615 [Lingula anatina]|uniref:Uncharacterized protein LOC106158615 n=1 Tax=Lingula anatina TaxID=7574 RepID=A0A1S3HVT8_LINAN|nr:uncharacterized protein LOC106158615 [Lingula anatina]|eukprot:XP_013390133.1 uncharacterized protein LOC106158615 [Lingula anatina]